MRIRVVRGGVPTPEQVAALALAVRVLTRPRPAPPPPAQPEDAWTLQGRMAALDVPPGSQRWPGEPPGRAWRRAAE